jgi:hypothetical protein
VLWDSVLAVEDTRSTAEYTGSTTYDIASTVKYIGLITKYIVSTTYDIASTIKYIGLTIVDILSSIKHIDSSLLIISVRSILEVI